MGPSNEQHPGTSRGSGICGTDLQLRNLELFIQKVRKYAELTELTPYVAHELIKAIYVGISWAFRKSAAFTT